MRRFSPFFLVILTVVAVFLTQVSADGVLGCGGFVKSDVDINFSVVEVKLYTPHGSIKYQTDCAPNTGYYLIPLYDKGDFILKVEPPTGWSFEPASIELHVDGETDKCSRGEDINFVFTGFSLAGKVVSKGQLAGPAGVSVRLSESGSAKVLQTVETKADGSYQFQRVLPGRYDVQASQDQLRFEQSKTTVEVTDDNVDIGSRLVIAGYTVTGLVYSEGEPIRGVNFLLYSSTVKQQDVQDCDKSAVSGMGKNENYDPLCHVISDVSGKFTFPCLATGDYYLIPFYKGEHITFDVKPEKLPFQVGHASVKLATTFQVAGFSVTGQVLDSEKGSGVANAQVYLNGEATTKTGVDGTYHLENMKTGFYKLHVKIDNMFFDVQEVKITPNTPQLPVIAASKYNLCGQVTVDKLPDGLPQHVSKRKVIIFPEGKGSEAVSKETIDGRFCTIVKPGKYMIRVHITDIEARAGLTISPSEQMVTVVNKPVLDVSFSQFRAIVSGVVTCMEKCGPMEISLEAVGRTDKQIIQTQISQKGATFSFDNVLPGKYKATIMRDNLCWKDKTVEVEVTNQNVNNLAFQQTGYILKCTISHAITLNFAHEKKTGNVGSFELNKGKNRFCLAEPGVYKLIPHSCHKFEKEEYIYDTSIPETLTLTAVSHLVHGSVTTEQSVSDAVVTIATSLDQSVTTLGPLKLETDGNTTGSTSGPVVYKFIHWAKSNEKLTASVTSSEMLYTPASLEVNIVGDTCPGELLKFTGEKGQFIIGHVSPPLAGVKIIVTDPTGKMSPVTMETLDSGDFKIGPLLKGIQYEVTAQREGYVLEKQEGELAVFRALKLGKVAVKIVGENEEPLTDVLLSLSGGKQYRSNNLTKSDGYMLFVNLSPGQYYLRPMMKEYKFEPASQLIDVLEGSTMDINIRGVRTAYSCFGQVTSLNGEPEPGVFIEASGVDACSSYQEESKTEQNGNYRIRGLQPNCTYEVRLKIGEMNKHIERAAPKSRFVVVKDSDFVGVNIIAFRRMNQMDISGNVVTDPEFLPTLKVRLYKEDNEGVPMFTASLGVVSFFYLPSLQIDDMTYTVRLESSLSKNTHEYIQPEVEIKANISYKHVTFRFQPKRKTLEQELSQSSVLMLPLTLLAVFVAYNYKKIVPVGKQLIAQAKEAIHKQRQQRPTQTAAAPQVAPIFQEFDMQDSPVMRKKNKPRKT